MPYTKTGQAHNAKHTDQEFIAIWNKCGGKAGEVAKALDRPERAVLLRRRRIEEKLDVVLKNSREMKLTISDSRAKVDVELLDGVVVVFSDAHFFPNNETPAYRGLLKVLREIKPDIVINNGDAFDGATISRHPRIGWDSKPSVKQELEAVQLYLGEIAKASGPAKLIWPLGNHDARFETRLAAMAPQYEGVFGFSLKDHFPEWLPCWGVMINNNTMVKHKYHNGTHGVYNNTVKAGTSFVTGHLHSLKVTPWSDYNGDRYGVDTGTLADPNGPQFEDYMELNPRNWRAGFAVLTFHEGELMPPELAQVIGENKLCFRGKVYEV